jgi:hypothetical protein
MSRRKKGFRGVPGETSELPLPQDVDEGLPRIVRRNPSKPVTKLCINCLSPLERGSELGGWLVPQDYYCKNCGYKGYVYLEDRRSEDAEGKESAQPPPPGEPQKR